MQRLKIIKDDVPIACGDVFGVNVMLDRLEAFCREQGIEKPIMRLIEVNGVLRPYAVSLHLVKNDQMNQFDAEVVFLLTDFPNNGNWETEECRLKMIAKEFGKPCMLTTRAAFSSQQDILYSNLGFLKMPVTWSDEAGNVYEVFLNGLLEMGSFVSLMEHVEYIGKEFIYV